MVKKVFKLRIVFLCLCFAAFSIITHAQSYAWAKGLEGDINISSIVTDVAGNVYIAGGFSGTVDIDPGSGIATLIEHPNSISDPSYYPYDMFIAKYDSQGNYIWAKSIGGTGQETVRSMAIDIDGAIYVSGMSRSDTLDFDPSSGLANQYMDAFSSMFFAKYDNDGNYIWAKVVSGAGAYGDAIAVDSSGAVAITGKFSSLGPDGPGRDFDPGPGVAYLHAGREGEIAFFAKYDSMGNYVWATCLNHTQLDQRYVGDDSRGTSVSLDGQGSAYFIGYFRGLADFDPGADTVYLGTSTTSNDAMRSAYIIKYDAQGNYLWAKAVTGTGGPNDFANFSDFVLDDTGNIYITGGVRGAADFDPDGGIANIGTPGVRNGEIFLAKYDNNGNYIWANNMGSRQPSGGSGISRSGNSLYVVGNFNGTIDFDPGAGVSNLTSLGGGMNLEGDIFIAKYETSGVYLCAQIIGGLDAEIARVVTTDNKGRVYLTGNFSGTTDFDPGKGVVNIGIGSSFILKLACEDINRISVSLCQAENSYTLNDSTYTVSGIYTQVFPNESAICGCDSIIELNLTFIPLEKPEITVSGFLLGLTSTYTSYQWFKNGMSIAGAKESKYEVKENADYSVVVANAEGCMDTSEIYKVTNTGTDGLSGAAKHISIYPNPTNDLIYIYSPTSIHSNISVSGIEGNILLNASNATSISLKDFANGIYFIRIVDIEGNLIKIEKLVKQ